MEKAQHAIESYFEQEGSRILERESVLLFYNTDNYGHVNLQFYGIITEGNSAEMAKSYLQHQSLIVGVQFHHNSMRLAIKSVSNKNQILSSRVTQARTKFFSYTPILSCLQGKDMNYLILLIPVI